MKPLSSESPDPVTLSLLQQALGAVTDEMFAINRKTAMSSVIYEVLDFGVAITDGQGALASAGAGIPGFVGMLDPCVQALLAKFDPADIADGDIFLSNDPYAGGVSHINDVVLAMPVFVEGTLIAWAASKGHWMDLGGRLPGSTSPDATELFQEGLLLPDIKVIARGQVNPAVLDIIAANSRLPDQALGDFWAAVAAIRMGRRHLVQLCARYGKALFLLAVADHLDSGERAIRKALRAGPHGTFLAQDALDDGRPLRVAVTVSPDQFIVDLRDNPVQDEGPLNATFGATLVSAQAMFKSIMAPQGPANAGSFRPLSLLTTPGSLFHAEHPGATGLYYENKIRSADLIWKALAPHFPSAAAAGHFGAVCATTIGKDDGQLRHNFIEPEPGGWGASSDSDGQNALFSSSHGDTFNCPVEMNEARNGIFVDHLRLNPEPTGAGQFRGGKGIDLHYRIVAPNGWVTGAYARSRVPPWGLAGGGDGSCNHLSIARNDDDIEMPLQMDNVALGCGDRVRIRTGNGGGFGDPQHRDRSRIFEDLRNEMVTPAEAREVYDVPADQLSKWINQLASRGGHD